MGDEISGRWQRRKHDHRAGESGDFSSSRHGMDPTMKKLLFALLALLLAVVGTLLGFDRADIKGDATTGLKNSVENRAELGLVKLEQAHIKADVEDLKDGQKAIVRGQQTILDTLYKLPSQRRPEDRPVLEEPE